MSLPELIAVKAAALSIHLTLARRDSARPLADNYSPLGPIISRTSVERPPKTSAGGWGGGEKNGEKGGGIPEIIRRAKELFPFSHPVYFPPSACVRSGSGLDWRLNLPRSRAKSCRSSRRAILRLKLIISRGPGGDTWQADAWETPGAAMTRRFFAAEYDYQSEGPRCALFCYKTAGSAVFVNARCEWPKFSCAFLVPSENTRGFSSATKGNGISGRSFGCRLLNRFA